MILVDSNVIIDVLARVASWKAWSTAALNAAVNSDEVAINPIIYAEIAAGFTTKDALDAALDDDFRRLPLPYDAGYIAGQAFTEYRRRGGPRMTLLPDFYIGAHAAASDMRLLTRDPGRYRSYFPSVTLIAPA